MIKVIAGVIVGLASFGSSSAIAQLETYKLSGEIRVFDRLNDGFQLSSEVGEVCTGNRYQDMFSGLNITIYNASGEEIAQQRTELGITTEEDVLKYCSIKIPEIELSDFSHYVIELENNRGEIVYSKEDLIEKDWHITLSVNL